MSIYHALPNSMPLPIYFYEKKSYNDLRRCKIILFSHICNSYSSFKKLPSPDQYSIIRRLERSCYNAAVFKADDDDIRNTWSNLRFVDIYSTICAKITNNLDDSKKLFEKIIRKEIDINKIAFMSSQELQPDMYKKIIGKIEARSKQRLVFKECKLYKCGKCKSKKCKAEKLYNRGLDEGVNFEITCQECGYRWAC